MAKRQPNTSISAKSGKLLRFPKTSPEDSLVGMPPIPYSAKDVAKVVFWGSRESVVKFAKKVGEHPPFVTAVINQQVAPSAAILAYFNFEKDGEGYLWHPR